jgi:hypothetical protein
MAVGSIVGPVFGARFVLPLDPAQIDAAKRVAPRNGADDLFFAVGPDLYVASGRGMKLRGLEVGATFDANGQGARVVGLDDEPNTVSEGVRQALRSRDVIDLGVAGLVSGLPIGALLAILVGVKLAPGAGAFLAMTGTLLGTALAAGAALLLIGVGCGALSARPQRLRVDLFDAFARRPES